MFSFPLPFLPVSPAVSPRFPGGFSQFPRHTLNGRRRLAVRKANIYFVLYSLIRTFAHSMKNVVYIFSLLAVLLSGCTGTSRQPQLVAVDSILKSRPDSSLKQLKRMDVPQSRADRMYYYLLLADAANKCYDTLPSDSILQEVADFYDTHGTPNERLRAHYLLGCVYRDLGEAPQALDCYHDAVECADTAAKNCDFRTLMSVYGQMAELFHQQNLPQDEMWAREQSCRYCLAYGDTIGYIRSQELKAKIYATIGDTTRIIQTILKTHRLYKEQGNEQLAVGGYATLAYIHLNRNQINEAKKLLNDYEKHSGIIDKDGVISKGREGYFYIKGSYYIKINQLDSAEHYMRKLLVRGDETNAYRGLLTIYQQKKNTDSIIKYAHLYEDAVDTLNNRKRTEVVGQMSAMYNYQRFQLIADKEARKAERAKHISLIILLCSFFLIVILTYIYLRLRKKKNERIMRLSHEYRQSIYDYNKMSAELERIKEKDTTLLNDKQIEVDSLREKVASFQKKLQAANTSQQLTDFKDSNIVALFQSKSTGSLKVTRPTDVEWNRLIRQFSRSVPSLYTALGRDVLLSPAELRLCILLLLGFKIGDVAILLNTSAQSITNIRYKANQKLFNESTATTLEKNLTDILGKA